LINGRAEKWATRCEWRFSYQQQQVMLIALVMAEERCRPIQTWDAVMGAGITSRDLLEQFPQAFSTPNVDDFATDVFRFLATWCVVNGLGPWWFTIGTGTIAKRMGASRQRIWQAMRRLEGLWTALGS
jgi:hypothetical protein